MYSIQFSLSYSHIIPNRQNNKLSSNFSPSTIDFQLDLSADSHKSWQKEHCAGINHNDINPFSSHTLAVTSHWKQTVVTVCQTLPLATCWFQISFLFRVDDTGHPPWAPPIHHCTPAMCPFCLQGASLTRQPVQRNGKQWWVCVLRLLYQTRAREDERLLLLLVMKQQSTTLNWKEKPSENGFYSLSTWQKAIIINVHISVWSSGRSWDTKWLQPNAPAVHWHLLTPTCWPLFSKFCERKKKNRTKKR